MNLLKWLRNNKEWLFSGVGITIFNSMIQVHINISILLSFIISVISLLLLFSCKIILDFYKNSKLIKLYYNTVANEYKYMNSYRSILKYPFLTDLENNYIDLQLTPYLSEHNKDVSIKSKEIWSVINDIKKYSAKGITIIGISGSGKTTLLKYIALNIILRTDKYNYKIPILLKLYEHKQFILTTSESIDKLIFRYFNNIYPTFTPSEKWLYYNLSKGKCLLLLDGLDQIENINERRQIAKWIDQQILNYSKSKFVITSRSNSYFDSMIEFTNVYEIKKLNLDKRNKMITNWFNEFNNYSFNGFTSNTSKNNSNKSTNIIIRTIQGSKSLTNLSFNPLILNLILMSYFFNGSIPNRKSDIYEIVLSNLLYKALNNVSHYDFCILLSFIANNMMMENKQFFQLNDFKKIQNECPKHIIDNYDSNFIYNQLQQIEITTGIIFEKNNCWFFSHDTFQEYLTVLNWIETNRIVNLGHYVNKTWWHETLILFSEKANPSIIIHECLKCNTYNSLKLAFDIIDNQDSLVDNTIYNIYESHLKKHVQGTIKENQSSSAKVLLYRRLKNSFNPINDYTDIDNEFITNAEYQLFIDESKLCYQPDHWNSKQYQTKKALEPIAGIRFQDATEFCYWLTNKNQNDYIFRLPTKNESELYTMKKRNNNDLASWLNDGHLFFYSNNSKVTMQEKLYELFNTLSLTSKTITESLSFRNKLTSFFIHNSLRELKDFPIDRGMLKLGKKDEIKISPINMFIFYQVINSSTISNNSIIKDKEISINEILEINYLLSFLFRYDRILFLFKSIYFHTGNKTDLNLLFVLSKFPNFNNSKIILSAISNYDFDLAIELLNQYLTTNGLDSETNNLFNHIKELSYFWLFYFTNPTQHKLDIYNDRINNSKYKDFFNNEEKVQKIFTDFDKISYKFFENYSNILQANLLLNILQLHKSKSCNEIRINLVEISILLAQSLQDCLILPLFNLISDTQNNVMNKIPLFNFVHLNKRQKELLQIYLNIYTTSIETYCFYSMIKYRYTEDILPFETLRIVREKCR